MRRLIRKAAHRDDREQTTPPAPPAAAPQAPAGGRATPAMPPLPFSYSPPLSYPGLDAVPNPILFVRHPSLTIFYANPAAEATLAVSRRQLVDMSLYELFVDPVDLVEMIGTVADRQFDAKRRDLSLERPGHEALHVHAVVGAIDFEPGCALLELLPNEQKIRSEREERLLDLTSANKELIRNLAHEIKNPLGASAARRSCWSSSCPNVRCASTPRSSSRSPTGCRRWWTACWSRTGIRTSSAT